MFRRLYELALLGVLLGSKLAPSEASTFAAGLCGEQVQASGMQSPSRLLSVRDIIETTRFLNWNGCEHGLCFSPNGKRYLLLLAKGDVDRNGVHVEIVTGETQSLASAKPEVAANFFTSALGNLPLTIWNDVSWLSDDTVAFLSQDNDAAKQVALLDLRAKSRTLLTDHPTDVSEFRVSSEGSAIVYSAFSQRDRSVPSRMMRDGYVVQNADAYSFLRGNIDGWDEWKNIGLFVSRRGTTSPVHIQVDSVRGLESPRIFSFAPDARRVLIDLPIDDPPLAWSGYTERFFRDIALPQTRLDPAQGDIRQLFVLDVESERLQPLLDAPSQYEQKVVFSPDGSKVAIGPTFLPAIGSTIDGLNGVAVAVVDLATRRIDVLPVASSNDRKRRFAPMWWRDDVIELESLRDPRLKLRLRKTKGGWKELDTVPSTVRTSVPPVRIELRGDINSAPALVGHSESAQPVLLCDPNQKLREEYRLGRVEMVEWTSGPKGEFSWKGLLYYPVAYVAGRSYPLVIQTHGDSKIDFSLTGDNSYPSVFAAQALANRDIVVLQMGDPVRTDGLEWIPEQEARVYVAGAESAVGLLADKAIVDPGKVGLVGFSRTGWHVEYALTHSEFPYAAAVAADNVDFNYLQSALSAWPHERNVMNGGEPNGESLAGWLERSPAFNAHRVRTPLRLQVNSGDNPLVLTHWEMFGRLRAMNLPVELYIIPELARGTHNLQNPRQQLASAGGAVDWFDFWLNGREDSDLSKTAQYKRWRRLREQRDVALTQARPPLLEWHSTPKKTTE